MPTIQQTLGNESWVRANANALRNVFPINPVQVDLTLLTSVGYKLKLMGVEWREESDLPNMFSFLQRLNIIEVKALEGKIYVLQYMSPSDRAHHLRTQAMQKGADKINRTEPPADVKALADEFLKKLMKG